MCIAKEPDQGVPLPSSSGFVFILNKSLKIDGIVGNLFGGNSFSLTGTRFQCFPSPIVQFLGKFQFSGVTGFTVSHINERRNVWSCSSYSMIICEIVYQYRDDLIPSILFSIVQVSIFIHYEQSISFVMMGNTVTQRHKNILPFQNAVNPSDMGSGVEFQETSASNYWWTWALRKIFLTFPA